MIWIMYLATIGLTTADILTDAGITKHEDSYVTQLHSDPNIYLAWRIYTEDDTIWFTLNCQDIGQEKYCAFGITTPGLKPHMTRNMFNSDIYTAHGLIIDDRWGDSTTDKPRLDDHSDVSCDHCGVHDDNQLHFTFWRNLTNGDAHDVNITDQTYRIIWAIGPSDDGDIDYHILMPIERTDYKYINFLAPHRTDLPSFMRTTSGAAALTGTWAALQTLAAAALAGAVLVLSVL